MKRLATLLTLLILSLPARAQFDPLAVTGLFRYVEADQGTLFQTAGGTAAVADGDPVGEWQDEGATDGHFSQTTSAARPTLQLNEVNGHPGVLFDGVDDILRSTAFQTGQTGTVVLGMRMDTPAEITFWGASNESVLTRRILFHRSETTENVGIWERDAGDLDWIEAGPIASQWHLFVFQSDGSTYRIIKDGVVQSLTVVEGVNAGEWLGDVTGIVNTTIGGRTDSGGDQGLGNVLYTFVLESTAYLDGPELNDITEHFLAKYRPIKPTWKPLQVIVANSPFWFEDAAGDDWYEDGTGTELIASFPLESNCDDEYASVELVEEAGVSFATGHVGNGALFDGPSNNGCRRNATDFLLFGDTEWTVSAWVKIAAGTSVQNAFGVWGESGNWSWRFGFVADERAFGSASSDGTNETQRIQTTATTAGTWTHFIFDYSPTDELICVRRNVTEQSQCVAHTGGAYSGSTANFTIGYVIGFAGGIGIDLENGMIDELRVYSGKMTLAERNCEYNAGDGRSLAELSECNP